MDIPSLADLVNAELTGKTLASDLHKKAQDPETARAVGHGVVSVAVGVAAHLRSGFASGSAAGKQASDHMKDHPELAQGLGKNILTVAAHGVAGAKAVPQWLYLAGRQAVRKIGLG